MFILRCSISVIVFFLIFSGGILYTFNQTKIYLADGTLEVHDARPVKSLSLEDLFNKETVPEAAIETVEKLKAQVIGSEEDLNTAFLVLGSRQILMGVEQRIRGEARQRFMAPYVEALTLSGPLTPMEILEANRTTEIVGSSHIFRVRYTHPDPIIAAEVANLFMKEFIDYYLKHEIDEYMKMTEDLRLRVDQMDKYIEEKTKELNALLSDKNKNEDIIQINAAEKEALIDFRTKLYAAFNEAKTRVNLANPRARIIDHAIPPPDREPYQPDIRKNLSYAFFLGLFFAVLPHVFAIVRRSVKI